MVELVTRRCQYCEGTGEVDTGTFVGDYQPCPVCGESGNVRVRSDYIKCRKCAGTGKENAGEYIEWFIPCDKCHGTGWASPFLAYT